MSIRERLRQTGVESLSRKGVLDCYVRFKLMQKELEDNARRQEGWDSQEHKRAKEILLNGSIQHVRSHYADSEFAELSRLSSRHTEEMEWLGYMADTLSNTRTDIAHLRNYLSSQMENAIGRPSEKVLKSTVKRYA